MRVLNKKAVFCTVIGVGVYLGYGKPEVVFKETIEVKELTSYEPKVLWPNNEETVEAGEGSGVTVNSEGDIYFLHRASGTYSGKAVIKEPTIVVLDSKTRTVKQTWGAGLFKSPHGLEIDVVTTNKGKIASAEKDLKHIKVIPIETELSEPRSDNIKEIAKQKVLQAFSIVQRPCIALDSGFFVSELNGFPRAYVNHMLDTIGIDGILKLLGDVENRYAEFR